MEQFATDQIKKTALHDIHVALGAKMVEFGGWDMPLYYQGIIAEHHAVRKHVGIFDVSHMGRVLIEGPDAESFLDYLSTNIIAEKPNLSATYTAWCHPRGGCVDDVIVYKIDSQHLFVIVNAGNRQKDLAHLQHESREFNVRIKDRFAEEGIISIQGPNAYSLIQKIFPKSVEIKPMHFAPVIYKGQEIILSHTGYTGAGGFEIYAPHSVTVELWKRFLDEGKAFDIVPIGLGARDTLRLEMGYALYGHEITDDISPNESVANWTVKWKKQNFLGKSALEQLERKLTKRSEYGIVLIDKGVPRAGYEIWNEGRVIGTVTSGSFSPTLNQSIAIILVQGSLHVDDIVEVQIRQHRCQAKVVKLPFVQG